MLGLAWRPLLGAAVMVLVLHTLGLRAPAEVPQMPLPVQLVLAIATGAATFVATTAGLWFACCQPEGAEADILTALRHGTGALRQRLLPS